MNLQSEATLRRTTVLQRIPAGGVGLRTVGRFLAGNPLAMLGLLLLLLLLLGCILAPLLTPYSPLGVAVKSRLLPPSLAHPLGTDHFGRDVLSRVLYGGRATLSVGLLVILVAAVIGLPLGLVAGYAGGACDGLIMRVVDAWLAFPGLVLAIALAALLRPSLHNAMLAVALTLAPQFARLARGQALQVSNTAYVEAARALGVGHPRLIARYVLPNCLGPLLVQVSLSLGSAILQTASLGFLGLGAQPPAAEWGADVAATTRFLREAPWVALAPGGAILLAVIAFNLLGDALGDWADPQRRHVMTTPKRGA